MLSSYSIDMMEQELEAMLHGTTLNQITNLIGLENRAARQLLLDLDPQETKRVVEFVAPIFNGVYDYPIATDVKGNKLIDIFPQVQRLPWDIWTQSYNQAFDVTKQNIFSLANMFTMSFNTGIKTIRMNAPFLNTPVIINEIEGISLNGTWAVGGTATSLSVNNTNFAQGAGSLQFNIDENVGTNLVTNGGFTGSAANWSLSNFVYGSNNITISGNPAGGDATSTAPIALANNTKYTLSFDLNITSGTCDVIVGDNSSATIFYDSTTDFPGGITSVNNGTFTVTFTTSVATADAYIVLEASNNTTMAVTNFSIAETSSGVGVGYLENSTMTAVDLSTVEDQSYFFTWVYIPNASNLTSVNLRIGSSSSDYWSLTTTQTQQGTAFVNGWNLCQFPWSSMISTGSPDSSSIDYARITLTISGAMVGCLLNGLDSILGTVLSYSYYSKYLFRDAVTGAFQETVTDGSNLINLDTETFNLYVNLVAMYAVQQQQGMDGLFFDASFFQNAYQQGLERYKSMYKSELQKPQSIYYKPPNPGYNWLFGRQW